jgi:hypothetical protein
MSACACVEQLGSPLDEFSCNLIFEDCAKIWWENSSLENLTIVTGTLLEDPMEIYDNISLNSS